MIGSTPLVHNLYLKLKSGNERNPAIFETGVMTLTIVLLLVCLMAMSSQTFRPFIYARF